MHISCSNDMPDLPHISECGAPIGLSYTISGTYYPSAGELAFLEQLQADSVAAELKQVDNLLAARMEPHQPMVLMVGEASMAQRIARHLSMCDVTDVEVQVAAQPGPVYQPEYWTPAMAEAKAAYWDAQQPRHRSTYTHTTPPTTKARKAARRRARAGRKANR
jgi:hypothetical protein